MASRSEPGEAGGTSRPFSPSCTTSGTPPTAVAITGVPTASASSTVCGRFSHRRREQGCIGGGEESHHVVARPGAEKPHAAVEPALDGPALETAAVRAVAEHEQRHARHLAQSVERQVEGLLDGEPAGEGQHDAVDASSARNTSRAAVPEAAAPGWAPRSRAPDRLPSRGQSRAGRSSARERVRHASGPRYATSAARARAAHPESPGTPRASR